MTTMLIGWTTLYANGIALKDIQEQLGHSGIGTTGNIYTHPDYNSKINFSNKILDDFSLRSGIL